MIKRLRKGNPPKRPTTTKPKGSTAATSTSALASDISWKYPYAEQTILLAKWLNVGLDSPQHNFLIKLDFKKRLSSPQVMSILFLLEEVFRCLPVDNSSGSLMQFLCNTVKAKLQIEDPKVQEAIDVALGYLNLDLNFMGLIREWLYPKRLEIHQFYDQISNEKKRFVNIALKMATQLFCNFKATNQTNYDLSINL